MRTRFQVRCLGEPALLTLGGRTVRVRTRKEMALLCYLAIERRWHTRDALAELLWPDRPRRESRHSLAVALSALRGKLGREILETERERVRVRPDGVAVDVDRLLAGDVVGSDTEVPLDVDGFLEGFEIPQAVAFAHWRDAERGRLLPHVLDALVVLLDRCRRRGDFRQIETLALRLQRFEPLSEHAMRARMEARAFSGDRLTALRLFEQWKRDLAEQLQAVPSDLVEGMALRLRRRGWERPGAADIPTVHTDQWKDRPFVGRAAEYRELYEAWEAVQRCEPAHRLILGDSGIGKSTLVERVTTAAGLEGATVARVQCHEAEREIPYAMISGLIAQLVDRPGASAAPPESLAELAQTIPEVRRRFPVLPAPLETQGDAARIRFTEATHALIGALAEEHPVILVVDDVHHADDVSLAVLHRVIRLSERQALLVFFLARPGELHQSPQASRLHEEGNSLGIRHLQLPALLREDAIALLDELLADPHTVASPTVRRTLLAASAGYPLVLELLVGDWLRSGDRSVSMALDAVTADPGISAEPEGAYSLLTERLIAHLEPITRTVLDVASVLGPRLNDASLYAVADLRISEVMSGLTSITALRLLRDAGSHVEFANDLVRGHVYLRVHGPTRRLLHERIAATLISRQAQGDDTLDLEIAWHSMRCGMAAQAEHFLLQGSRTAIARGAIHEAERRLASAVQHLAGAHRTEAVLLLAELLQEQARYAESREALLADDVAANSLWGMTLSLIADIRSDLRINEYDEQVSRALRLLSQGNDVRRGQVAMVRLACHLIGKHPVPRVAEALHERLALPAYDDWTGEDAIELRTQRLYLAYFAGLPSATEDLVLVELLKLITESNAVSRANLRAFRLLSGAGLCHKRAGRYDEALSFLTAALATARKLEHESSIGNGLNHMASWCLQTGAFETALRYAEEGFAITRHYSEVSKVHAEYYWAIANLHAGRAAPASGALERLEAWTFSDPSAEQLAALFGADIYWLLDMRGKAYASAEKALHLGAGEALRPSNASLLNKWTAVLAQQSARHRRGPLPTSSVTVRPQEAWDAAENDSALLLLSRIHGTDGADLSASLQTRLRSLPRALGPYLDQFGLPLA